jgi:hypothetical protein
LELERKINATIAEEQHAKTIHAIRFLFLEAMTLGGANGPIETTNAIFLLSTIRGTELQSAQALLFDLLMSLELILRDDAQRLEQLKYRTTSKDPQKKSAKDFADAELVRVRCAIKLFALRCLNRTVDLQRSVSELISLDQALVDVGLDELQKNGAEFKEIMSQLQHASEMESARNATAPLNAVGVSISIQPPMCATPSFVRAAPAAPQKSVCDFRFPMDVLSKQFLFDAQAHSAAWLKARSLIAVGCDAMLSTSDQGSLIQCLTDPSVLQRSGLTPSVVCRMAAHNALVVSTILSRMADPSSHLLEIISSSEVGPAAVETILLNCAKVLQQIHVYKYVAAAIARLKKLDGNARREVLLPLVSTLHQLVTKLSKDNKELYIAPAQKTELDVFVSDFSTHADITTRWDEMK